MDLLQQFETALVKTQANIGAVVDFDRANDRLFPFDFTAGNTLLTDEILNDTSSFSDWVEHELSVHQCRYGIGGYNEHRTIYNRSAHFDTAEEPRRLHLGVDIWGPAGTPVYNFFDAEVHSFKNNALFGDYGGTIILKYTLAGFSFYVLYGHLSVASINGLQEGQKIPGGAQLATLGIPAENGGWPPHLHFQLMFDMQGMTGDYPGVCRYSKKEEFLSNCPDPALILAHTFSPFIS